MKWTLCLLVVMATLTQASSSVPKKRNEPEMVDCTAYSFYSACNDGLQCIMNYMKCNAEVDCKDGSDEVGCGDPVNCDETTHFECKYNTYPKCVEVGARCDMVKDCDDSSDEDNCDYQCKDDQFLCKNKDEDWKCFPKDWECDGVPDCKEDSDEVDCPAKNCDDEQFKCLNYHGYQECFPLDYKCDYDEDCGDGSDEDNCTEDENVVVNKKKRGSLMSRRK